MHGELCWLKGTPEDWLLNTCTAVYGTYVAIRMSTGVINIGQRRIHDRQATYLKSMNSCNRPW